MNIVELLIFCAACEIIDQCDEPEEVTHIEERASRVVGDGMYRLRYRFRPGILVHPWAPYFYPAKQAVEMLKLKAKGWRVGDLAFPGIRPATYTNSAN